MEFLERRYSLIKAFVNAGVGSDDQLQVKYRLHALNRFCLYTIVLATLWYAIFLYAGINSAAIFIHFVQLFFGLVVYANYKKQYTIAKITLILATNFSVLGITYLLGYNAGFYLYLYTAPLFVFWLFDIRKEKSYITFSICLYFVCYLLTLIMKKRIPSYTFFDSAVFGVNMYDLNLLFSLILMFLLFNNYTRYYVLLGEQVVNKQEYLEKEIERRTESEQALQKLFHELSKSHKSLEQFGFIVSHNMKAPFANIKGLLGLYDQEGKNNDDNNVIIDNIQQSVNHLDTILKDLGYLLTLKRDLLQDKTDVLLSEMVQEIKKSLSYEIQTSHASFTETYSQEISLNTVRPILYSILFNLIHNAIKYRNKEEPLVIEIKASILKGKTHIDIADNGMGIDMERYRDRVFNLYSRFHRDIEGKGVGLYLVKTQTEMLGGNIDLESEPGKGTTFKIEL